MLDFDKSRGHAVISRVTTKGQKDNFQANKGDKWKKRKFSN